MAYKKGEKLKTPFATYTIDGPIGAGPSGEVYLVRDSEGLPFAGKILNASSTTPDRVREFRRAFEFCIKNEHPGVARIHDMGLAKKGAGFYVMPFYAESLRDLIARGMAPGQALTYFSRMLDGVEAGHLHHVSHLNVKPENMFLDPVHEWVVVADFGVAHLEKDDLLAAAEYSEGNRARQFPYAAPEQRVREAEIDHRADIYSLGVILHEMITGSLPSAAESKPIVSIDPHFAYLDELIAEMSAPDPAQRPASIDELKRQLIARGNEYFSRQRLNALKTQVIAESEAGDSFLANPIRIVSADYLEGIVYFKLNTTPTPNWMAAFKNPRSAFSFYTGAEPETFIFNGDAMNVRLPGDASARQFVQYTKSYIDMANAQYREHVIAFHQRQMQAERESLRHQMAEEERRLRILTEIRDAI